MMLVRFRQTHDLSAGVEGLGCEIPDEAVAWLREQMGDFRVIRCCRIGSQRTGVWQLQSGSAGYYFKINHRRVRWGTEVFVYRNWAHAFHPFVAKLCGVLEASGLHGLLLSSLDGVTLREANLPPAKAASAYRTAGELCRRLHELPPGDWFGTMDAHGRPVDDAGNALAESPRDPAAYYERLIEGSLRAASDAGTLLPPERETVSRVLGSLSGIEFSRPVPTSRDYTPNNWIVDNQGRLVGIIDFENMGWWMRTDPFVRLVIDYFPYSPECERAFYHGYGAEPPKAEPEQLHIGCVLYGLNYAMAAGKTGDPKSAERARRAFAVCAG